MHKITLITFGRIKNASLKDSCDEFVKRLSKYCDLENVILSAGKKEEENKRAVAFLEKFSGTIVALDEAGKEYSSSGFASWLAKQKDAGMSIAFLIGGAYGLDDEIKDRAQLVLSLGTMTFPHELAQLMFLEQLYRAHNTLAGGSYHHE